METTSAIATISAVANARTRSGRRRIRHLRTRRIGEEVGNFVQSLCADSLSSASIRLAGRPACLPHILVGNDSLPGTRETNK